MEEILDELRKYNFWDREQPNLGFHRAIYLDKIYKFCGNSLIKVISGQRRCGKSYLLRQIASKLIKNGIAAKNIFYLNKEYIEFDDIKNHRDLDLLIKKYEQRLKPKGKIYLFIDEIQNIDQWERLVNSYAQNFAKEYEVFISGSNSKMLSGELATLLSGRYVNFEILPFGYEEYVGIKKVEKSRSTYLDYLQSGGLPELYALPEAEMKQRYIASVKDTVLLRDVIQRHVIKEPKLLEDLFIYVLNTFSNLMSINNITKYFKGKGRKVSYDTIANYLSYIEDCFLIHKVDRYNIKGKDTIAGNVKYYCNDLSFKNYLFSGFAHGVGYMLENLIYLELRRSGYKVYVGTLYDKEVDFVAQKADRTIYVQCTYMLENDNTIEREYASLDAIPDHYEKILVSLDDFSFPSRNGIRHLQAWNFSDYLATER